MVRNICFDRQMLEKNDPYLTELAQHIVTLNDFWRSNASTLKPGTEIRILRTLIEIGMDIEAEYAEPIAHMILKKLETQERSGDCEVETVTAVLLENAVAESEQPSLFEVSVYR